VQNEGNQPQQLPQRSSGQLRPPEPYGWQYDQEYPEVSQQASQRPPSGMLPEPPQAPQTFYGPPVSPQQRRSAQFQARSQEPLTDMGLTLGYGQGMEYQYFDAPQPSQPLERLRQERLQYLREERMRHQQRRMGNASNNASVLPWRGKGAKPGMVAPPLSGGKKTNRSGGSSRPLSRSESVQQMSPLSGGERQEILPVRASTVSSPHRQPLPEQSGAHSAAAPAQDTGMIQRVRIGRAAMILTGAFIASRVLGLLRTSMFAFVFGTSNVSDAYLQAFLIPDLIFNIVAGGALSSAFIPAFVAERNEKSAWRLASSALNLAVVIMIVLAVLAIIFAPYLVPLYNPAVDIHTAHDLAVHQQEVNLIISLTRIMLLQPIALGAGVIITSVLQAKQDFMLPALGTVLYNVGIIFGLIPGIVMSLHGRTNTTEIIAVYCVTWGVVAGAVLQVLIQIPGLWKQRMRYSFSFDWRDPTIHQIGRQMVPRIINAAMLYFSTFVDRGLITLLAAVAGAAGTDGLITQYNQALQLVLLPLSIFGMSISTAAFPTLAENVTKGRLDRVRNTIMETLRSIIFMSIPSSVGLMVLALPVIQALFEHGAFSLSDAEATAIPLGCFSIGLAGLAAVEILTRSFYAFRDSKTPVMISVAQFIVKIALSLILIDLAVFWGPQWGLGILAFSTSVAATLEASVLFWVLRDRVGGIALRPLGLFIGRVLLASAIMAIGLLIVRTILDLLLVTTRSPALGIGGTLIALIKVMIEIFVGLLIYLRVSRLLGIEELELGPVRRVLARLKLSWI
jgi:putative peptidoglycan lipid II flippase